MPSSLTSTFGLVKQSAFGSPVTTGFHYMKTMALDLGPDQRTAPFPQEMGGNLFVPEGHFKQGVIVTGGVEVLARPDYLGYLLYGALGAVEKNNSGSPVIAHTFDLSSGSDVLPYFTCVRNTSGLLSEQYDDCVVSSMRLTFPTAGLATARFELVGSTPHVVGALEATGVDDTPVLTTCQGAVTIPGLAAVEHLSDFTLDFTNGVDPGQYYIGSYFVDSLPVLARAATLSFTVRMRDASLYKNVYYNGGAEFSGVVYRGTNLSVKVQTPGNIPGGDNPYSLELKVPEADYLVAPISLSPGNIVTLACSATVVCPDNGKALSLVLTNGTDTAYSA
jgi:hypothetical protein